MAGTFTKHYSDVQCIPFITVRGKSKVFSPADKAVYFYLLSLQENAGQVFPSIATLSRKLGMPERTVQRSIKWLREALLVDVQRRYDSSNLYSVTPPHEVIAMNPQGQDRQQENAYQEAVQEPVEGYFNPW
ncbi:helix-turn-helix domain-containing protein [Serratia ficaria]|uniref:helix-turn-helix domain-containing protein n=1 Tax=Serratia ficaria TaxID=61651 RepID=UPI00077C6EE9|nr:helix-turn-helix domain-containing protein [Serratia ficaria]